MANASVARPLGEAHLADEPRLHPVMATAGRGARVEWRRRAGQRLQGLPQSGEPGVIEPGADLGHVHEATAVVPPEVQGPEVAARALRIRVPDDHELLPPLALDLDPVPRAPAGIGARGPLGHDAFEPSLRCGLEHRLAVPRDVVAVAEGAGGR